VARFVSDCRNEHPANEAFTSGSGELSGGRGEKECGKKYPGPYPPHLLLREAAEAVAAAENAAAAAAATVLVHCLQFLAATAAVCYNAYGCSSNSSD
jgi:hypothetical protein